MASLLWSIWVIVWLSLENLIQTHAAIFLHVQFVYSFTSSQILTFTTVSNFLTHQQSQTERKQYITLSAVSI